MAVAGIAAAAAVAAVASSVAGAVAAGEAADALGDAKAYMGKYVSRTARYTDELELIRTKYGGRADKAYEAILNQGKGMPSIAEQREMQYETAALKGAMAPYGAGSSAIFPGQAAQLARERQRYFDQRNMQIFDLLSREEGRYAALEGEGHKSELQGASEVAQLTSAEGVAKGQEIGGYINAGGQALSAAVGAGVGAMGSTAGAAPVSSGTTGSFTTSGGQTAMLTGGTGPTSFASGTGGTGNLGVGFSPYAGGSGVNPASSFVYSSPSSASALTAPANSAGFNGMSLQDMMNMYQMSNMYRRESY